MRYADVMQISSENLPPDLQIVEAAYVAALSTPDADLTRCMFVVRLGEAALKHRKSTNKIVQFALLRNWLRHWQWTLEYEGLPPLLLKDIDACIQSLMTNEFAEAYIKHNDYKRLVATLCVHRVFFSGWEHANTESPHLAQLVQVLTDRKPENAEITGIRGMSSFLFGDAFWELYRNEASWPGDMLKLLWRNQIPLLETNKSRQHSAELPEDMV